MQESQQEASKITAVVRGGSCTHKVPGQRELACGICKKMHEVFPCAAKGSFLALQRVINRINSVKYESASTLKQP